MRTIKILAISATLVLGLSACGNGNRNDNRAESEDDCRAPYACGPFYAGYVPLYYVAHPYSLYMSPYASMYSYNYSGGRMTVGRATTRPFTAKNVRIAAPKSPVNYGSKSKPVQAPPKVKTGNSGTGTGKIQPPPKVKSGSGSGYKPSTSGKR